MWRVSLLCLFVLLEAAQGAGKNRNTLLFIGEQFYILRELFSGTSLKERRTEWLVASAAGNAGIGPKVLFGGPDWFVMSYLFGRHPHYPELANPAHQGPFLKTLRALHNSQMPMPQVTDPQAVPLHGDLNPWNIILTGDQFLLIDWTDAHKGDPLSGLGYFALLNCLTQEETVSLLANYLQPKPTPTETEAIQKWYSLHQLLLGLKL